MGRTRFAAACALLCSAVGCSGLIADPPFGGSGSTPGDYPGGPGAPGSGTQPLELPVARVWRLTPLQYERSFTAAFGTTLKTAADFVRDPRNEAGLDDVASQNHVDIGWAELTHENASLVAAMLAPEIASSRPCLADASPSADCVGALVDEYGDRAFRRPVDDATRTALITLYGELRAAGNSVDDSVSGVLESIAQSPLFLYRVELGEPEGDGVERLDGYAIASQLSYMLTDAPPDDALLADAASGRLDDRAAVLEHAERLLETPMALQKVTRFFDEYLVTFAMRDDMLPKDPELFPRFTPAIQSAMTAETDRFVERVVVGGSGTLLELFTSHQTFVDDSLRDYYGWPGTASPDAPFDIPSGERAGVFMQGSVLASHAQSAKTDALHRGLYIYRRLLCQQIAPPEGIDVFELADRLDPPDPLSTERQRLEYLQTQSPDCATCHTVFTSLGLSLETFDAAGVFRTTQNGRPLDPSGAVTLANEEGGAYADAPALFGLIASSVQGQACFAQNWVSFAFGGQLAVPLSARLVTAFRDRELRIRDLLLLVTQEDAFYLRRQEDSP